MKLTLLTTLVLATGLASPAAAQRSLFDQPVQNAPTETPAPAPAPERPPSSAVPRAPVAATPQAPAPAAPTAAAPRAEEPAQAEEPAARPRRQAAKPRKPRGTVPARSLAVVNKSPNALVGLEVSQDGRTATLKKAVRAGKRTRLALPAFKACDVNVSATFEGQTQVEANVVDICKETVLNFTN